MTNIKEFSFEEESEDIDFVFKQLRYDYDYLQYQTEEDDSALIISSNDEFPKHLVFKCIYELQNMMFNKKKSLPYLIVQEVNSDNEFELKSKRDKIYCSDGEKNVAILINNQKMIELLSKVVGHVYQPDICNYSHFVSLFFEKFIAYDVESIFLYDVKSKSISKKGIIFLSYAATVRLNSFISDIYSCLEDEAIPDKVRKLSTINMRNFYNYKKYIDSLFKKTSRLLVLRVDFGIHFDQSVSLDDRKSNSEFHKNQVHEIRSFMNKYLNNIRKNRKFSHLKGYIWKLEYGFLKGCHYHCIFFFDGSKVIKDAYLASLMGDYWKEITNDKGYYFNCNKDKLNKYKCVGVGMINHYDEALISNLINKVLMYLVKKDQYISYKGNGKVRCMGHGGKPKPSNFKSGRPRSKTSKEKVDLNNDFYMGTEKSDCIFPPNLIVSLGENSSLKESNSDKISWIPSQEVNGFFTVLGSSGSGKTESLKSISQQILNQGFPLLVIDFHGDIELKNLESTIISPALGGVVGINPLQIISFDAEKYGLAEQRRSIVSMFTRAIQKLSPKQIFFLEDALLEAYKRCGIFDDNPKTWTKPAPNMNLVLTILKEWSTLEVMKKDRPTIFSCIILVRHLFGDVIFNRDINLQVDRILKSSNRIKLNDLHENFQFLVAETLLTLIFRKLRQQGPIPVNPINDRERFRIFIMIDEAKILTTGRGDPNNHRGILNVLVTEARKFGIGLILASQMVDHFGEDVNSNVGAKLYLKTFSAVEAKKNALDMQMPYKNFLNLNGKGDGYYKNNQNPLASRVQLGL